MNRAPRVALFTDTFHEVNGVALTCRQFAAYASRNGLPLLRAHPGSRTRAGYESGQAICELAPSPCSLGFEADLRFDLFFLRHRRMVREALERFRPDIVHVTAPGHVSILGAMLAHELGVPLAASWHTNVHEFGARRLSHWMQWLPRALATGIETRTESAILAATVRYYRIARLLFAPNPELRRMLATRTGKPVFPMHRGVDLSLFKPCPGARTPSAPLMIGYVGRLTPEKNLRLLVQVQRSLAAQGLSPRFLIVGQGSERDWLRANLPGAEFTGVLRGEAFARAYASMDVFAFPSTTDTYGNVVQEAKACGVPVVVTSGGGPKYLVNDGADGIVAGSEAEFSAALQLLAHDDCLRARMSEAAAHSARSLSWDAVFDGVYAAYGSLAQSQGPAFRSASATIPA